MLCSIHVPAKFLFAWAMVACALPIVTGVFNLWLTERVLVALRRGERLRGLEEWYLRMAHKNPFFQAPSDEELLVKMHKFGLVMLAVWGFIFMVVSVLWALWMFDVR